ncbi:MAG: cobalamin-binding protein, partial [Bradyrhizobium sp.]
MTDVNEQSFSAGTVNDSAATRLHKTTRQRIPAPIWRFRPALKPVGVVKTIKTQIIPRIVLALRSLPTSKPADIAEQTSPSAVEQFAALVLGH